MAILTEAAMTTIPTARGSAVLAELSEDEELTLRNGKLRDPASTLARRYFKVLDSVAELEKHLDAVPKSRLVAAKPAPKALNHLALVPLVDTAAPGQLAKHRTPTVQAVPKPITFLFPAWRSLVSAYDPLPSVQLLKTLFRILGRLFFYAPILLAYCACLYAAALFGYLLTHPELLVDLGFSCLDAVPQYAGWAGKRMAEAFASGVASRVGLGS